MKNAKSVLIIITSLAFWMTASPSLADGSLNTQYRSGNNRNTTTYYHNQNPVIYPQQQYYYPQGTTVIIVQQPQRNHSGYRSGYDVYQRNLKRNRIGYDRNNRRHSRQNQCLGSQCGK